MTVYSGTDFVIVDVPTSPNTTSTPTVTVTPTPTPTEDTTAAKTVVGTPYASDLSIQGGSKTFSNLSESTSYLKAIDLTCSISGGTTITYGLQPNGVNTQPTWVTLDDTNKSLNFTTPSVSTDTNYTFNIVATQSGTDYVQTIYLEVKDVPDDDVPDKIQAAIGTTLVFVSVSFVTSISFSMLVKTSFQSAWSMVNQIQLLLLLPMLVNSLPIDVKHFIYGMEILLFSFNSIPLKDIPGVYNVLELLNFEHDVEALKELGAESESAIFNIFIDLLILGVMILIHIILRCFRPKTNEVSQSFCKKLISKLYKTMTFSVYVRFFCETYLFFAL
jgi:hypothetical protein